MSTGKRPLLGSETDETVLVRRVVEARRANMSGNDAGAASANKTNALPPMNEKTDATADEADESKDQDSFWKKLRCW